MENVHAFLEMYFLEMYKKHLLKPVSCVKGIMKDALIIY